MQNFSVKERFKKIIFTRSYFNNILFYLINSMCNKESEKMKERFNSYHNKSDDSLLPVSRCHLNPQMPDQTQTETKTLG